MPDSGSSLHRVGYEPVLCSARQQTTPDTGPQQCLLTYWSCLWPYTFTNIEALPTEEGYHVAVNKFSASAVFVCVFDGFSKSTVFRKYLENLYSSSPRSKSLYSIFLLCGTATINS